MLGPCRLSAQDLIDHFVVAGVAHRLGEGTVDEGRAQQQRMQGRLREVAVGNRILFWNASRPPTRSRPGNCGPLSSTAPARLMEHVVAQTRPAASLGRAFDMSAWSAQREVSARNARISLTDHLVIAADAKAALPSLRQNAALRPKCASGRCARHSGRTIRRPAPPTPPPSARC